MSKLTNDHRKGAEHEQLALKNLETFTGYKAWNTPLWEKIDFTLSNDNFVNIIGEIKTRQNLFKFGWFVAEKKVEVLTQWAKVMVNAKPWFVVLCLENNSIYILDLASDYKYEKTLMSNVHAVKNGKEVGFLVPLEYWQSFEVSHLT